MQIDCLWCICSVMSVQKWEMTHLKLSDKLLNLNLQWACGVHVEFFLPQSLKWPVFHIYWHINYFVKLFMCSHSPPVGEANNCESVIEMRTYVDAAPVCFLGWQPSVPSLRGVHSNAFVIIIRSAFFSSTQIYNCSHRRGIWPMTCSSCMKSL